MRLITAAQLEEGGEGLRWLGGGNARLAQRDSAAGKLPPAPPTRALAQSIRRRRLPWMLLLQLLHNRTQWPPQCAALVLPLAATRRRATTSIGAAGTTTTVRWIFYQCSCDAATALDDRPSGSGTDGRRRLRCRQGDRKGVRRPDVHPEAAGHPARRQLGKPATDWLSFLYSAAALCTWLYAPYSWLLRPPRLRSAATRGDSISATPQRISLTLGSTGESLQRSITCAHDIIIVVVVVCSGSCKCCNQ